MITLEQAKALKRGDRLYHAWNKNADGSPERWRVNGKVHTWKKHPERVVIPVKHGLHDYGYIDQDHLNTVNL